MKKLFTFLGLVTLLLTPGLKAQTDAEMKAWQEYMQPGEVHKMIAHSDGEWNNDITMWMDSTQPPTKTTAVSKNEMIMGGRYQLSKTTGTMMGMPFEGLSLLGYDNKKKIFTSTWIDNFGTGTLTSEGAWDEQAKTINLKGKSIDPMSGKEIMIRQVIKFIDNDTQQFEMFDDRLGKEVKSMEIKLTRKK